MVDMNSHVDAKSHDHFGPLRALVCLDASVRVPRPEGRTINAAALDTAELSSDRAAPGTTCCATLLRLGIRRMCTQHLLEERAGGPAAQAERQA